MTGTGAYRIADATPDHLMITVPGTSLGSSWISVILIAFFLLLAYTTSRSVTRIYRAEKTPLELRAYVWRYRIIVMTIGLAGLGAFWLLGYSSGSIELDRGANRVTMRSKRTAFLPAQTQSLPLAVVERAALDMKPNSARIRLITREDGDLGYPMWSNRPGQAEAVKAINHFLHPDSVEKVSRAK
jgi:hypothetical protein